MPKKGENIHFRKDGRWEGRYIRGHTREGKSVWGYVYGPDYATVKKKLVQKKAECGLYALAAENPTFQELAELWLAYTRNGVKASTLSHYRYTLQHYLMPQFGGMAVQTLDEGRIEGGLNYIIQRPSSGQGPLSSATARECLAMMRRICKYAAHLHLIRPMQIQVRLPRSPVTAAQPLSDAEQARVQTFALQEPTPHKIGLLLALQSGLRIGEICGLRWEDFDLTAGIVQIRRTVCRISCGDGSTKVVVQSPKSATSARCVPLPHAVTNALRTMYSGQADQVWFLSGTPDHPTEPRCYRKSIERNLRAAGVHVVHPHMLRHTFATTCLQAGCDLKTLSELLGHSNPNVTLQRYVHTDMERKQQEIHRIFKG